MHVENSFTSLMIVVVLALAVPVVTTQLRGVRIPTVVGEIVAGIIIGKSGLNLIGEDPWLALLSTLGFAFLMFLSGLELDMDAIIGRNNPAGEASTANRPRLSPALLGFASFALTLAAAFGVSLGLHWCRIRS